MIIKKFQAETEKEAIVLAQNELGKEAIVMNIKTVKPKGLFRFFKKPQVEITAAVDDNVSYGNGEKLFSEIQKMQTVRTEPTRMEKKEQFLKNNPDILPDEPEPELEKETSFHESALEKKLDNLQVLIEKQMLIKEEERQQESQEENKESIACLQLIYKQLLANEVDEKYANQIIAEIEKGLKPDASVDKVLSGVYQKIILKIGETKTISLEENKTKFVFFIGPTGVGKTTTIAKIASSFNLKKQLKVGLVTSDTYRIAAVEQLKVYANILSIPLRVVYSADEMEDVKKEFAGYDVVLIDTAGHSHKNKEQREDVERLIQALPEEEREVYLVLSATTKYQDLLKIAQTYKDMVDFNLIFTKLDETNCVGNIFNLKLFTGAPLSYTTCGQNVPDDMGKINAQNIAKQLLGGNE